MHGFDRLETESDSNGSMGISAPEADRNCASVPGTIKRPGRHFVYRLWRVGGLAIRTRPQ
ncbi:hypothetical protein PGTUg99_006023 [Puccinia graminis f. sp. tritici]|uniref:Uncharacterized protein n=1 Tax=Puccinia graminis f. sp. tritici TaxID=56615 RepID=A0A5B0N721_PUCGR|nr:hypothetical protein PGTUg99_006023 [Puccinia graminis f. sp. tritici]